MKIVFFAVSVLAIIVFIAVEIDLKRKDRKFLEKYGSFEKPT